MRKKRLRLVLLLLGMLTMAVNMLGCGVGTKKTVTSDKQMNKTQTDTASRDEDAGLIAAEPGLGTIRNLLATAMQPVGHVKYAANGGWNKLRTGAGRSAVTIGTSKLKSGLDDAAYIGWTVYNVFNTVSGSDGYVLKDTTMARTFSEDGWGTYVKDEEVVDYQAGDIMSTCNQVWMVLGSCGDGSVVFLECSDPGVRICGTLLEDGSESEAVVLARHYMSTYYPTWFASHPECTREYKYLTESDQMRWNRDTLSDDEEYTGMNADEILMELYGEQE